MFFTKNILLLGGVVSQVIDFFFKSKDPDPQLECAFVSMKHYMRVFLNIFIMYGIPDATLIQTGWGILLFCDSCKLSYLPFFLWHCEGFWARY